MNKSVIEEFLALKKRLQIARESTEFNEVVMDRESFQLLDFERESTAPSMPIETVNFYGRKLSVVASSGEANMLAWQLAVRDGGQKVLKVVKAEEGVEACIFNGPEILKLATGRIGYG